MKSTSYKVKIKASINGIEKVPSSITWIQGNDECLVRPCYKENDYLVVELIPDCIGSACIEGWLTFDDKCSNCEPIHFKRCFCSTNSDCTECEECNQNGICQSLCTENESCIDGRCKECDENHPCPNGQVCVNGRCVCPQGTFEKNGQCVECDENTILNKCQECVRGKIIEKPCDGNCNPITGDCVDCLNSGDCANNEDGRTVCDPDTHDCVCPPGMVWSAKQGKCIPKTCEEDKDCGDPCFKCTEEGCQPIICPEGFKCYNGECVEWPCNSESCDNGADCGPDCGCVEIKGIKQCVPCRVLKCNGLCEEALGCSCNNSVCVPDNNCGGYCDGDNLCGDPNCTCYNNQCVSCSNFDCEGIDCANRINCKCEGSTCSGGGGGNGCMDNLILSKKCGNNLNDCKLTASLSLDKGCLCDDIAIKIANEASCNSGSNDISLKLNLFKGSVNYNDFGDLSIGNNEFITGIIKTYISHYDFNGNLVAVTVTPVNAKSINNNNIDAINLIKNTHFKTEYNSPNGVKGTVVNIRVVAENIQIQNNGCTNYTSSVIVAEYDLDFRGATTGASICNVIQTIQPTTAYVNDTTSVKSPLFVWSKTASDFPYTKFQDNGDYNSKGWFRKVYGIKTSGGWEDVIGSIDDGLVNNYNYQVKVDCGCSKTAIHNNLDFCCLPEMDFTLSECNTKLFIPGFKVCSINGKINDSKISDYNKPYYRVQISHSTKGVVYKDLQFNNDNVTTVPLTYDSGDKDIIESVSILRYFKGGLLDNTICTKKLDILPVTLPEVRYITTCNLSKLTYDVTVNQTAISPKIISASFLRTDLGKSKNSTTYAETITMGNNNQQSISIPLRINGSGFIDFGSQSLSMVITFDNGCVIKYLLEPCAPDLKLELIPDMYSGKNCNPPTEGATISAEVYGVSNVMYSINSGPYQIQNSFTDLPPGTYIIRAKGIVNGQEVILEDTVDIHPKMEIEVTFDPPSLCLQPSSKLMIKGEKNSTYTIKRPDGTILTSNAQTNSQGIYTYPGISETGEYTVFNNTPSNQYCNANVKIFLHVMGEVVSPQVTFQDGDYCVGQEIPFRIFDNNKNRTYNVTSNTGSITPNPIGATSSGFNAIYISASNTPPVIVVSSSTNGCDTISQRPTIGNINITNGPIIGSPFVTCEHGTHTVSVNVTGVESGNVKIGDVIVTPSGTMYTRTGIVNTHSLSIEASNGVCTAKEIIELQSCNCPNVTVGLTITDPTCGPGEQLIAWDNLGVPSGFSGTFQLYEESNNEWYALGGNDASGIFPPVGNWIYPVWNDPVKNYKVLVTSDNGLCKYEATTYTSNVDPFSDSMYILVSPRNPTYGDFVTLTVQNEGPDCTYLWAGNGVSGETTNSVQFKIDEAPFSYCCMVTKESCSKELCIDLDIQLDCNNPPSIVGTLNDLGPCESPYVIGKNGNGPRRYEWSLDNFDTIIYSCDEEQGKAVLDTDTVPAGYDGLLFVRVIDGYGCHSVHFNKPYYKCAYEGYGMTPTPSIVLITCPPSRLNGHMVKIENLCELHIPCDNSYELHHYGINIIDTQDPDVIIYHHNLPRISNPSRCVSYPVTFTFNMPSHGPTPVNLIARVFNKLTSEQIGSDISLPPIDFFPTC